MADIEKIKRNIKRMIDGGAQESQINQYLGHEGVSIDDLKGVTEGTWAKSTWENIKEDAPEMTGATIGGVAGGTVGGIPGAIAGATLGGAAGRAGKQIYQHATGSPEAPETSLEAAKDIGMAGVEQGAYEAVGGAIVKVGGKFLAPFAKTVSERGVRAMKVLDNYMPKKMPSLLPAQITDHRGLDWLHTVAEYSLGGGNVIFKHNQVMGEAIEKMTDDLASTFGERVSPTELGDVVVKVVQGGWKDFKDTITTPLYNRVAKLVGEKGDIVSTLGLKNAISEKVEIVAKMKGLASEESGDSLVKAIQELPDTIDYLTAQTLRTRLRSLGSKFKATPGGESGVGLAKHLTKITDDAIDSALSKADKSAQYLWRGVNKIYKEGSEKYNNALLRSLIKKAERDPHAVMGMVFKKGGIKSINRTKKAVGAETWEKLQGWYIRDVIEKTSKDGIFQGERFLKELFNPSRGMSKDGVEAIFGGASTKQIKEIGNAIRVAQEAVGKSKAGGGVAIQLMQIGAVTGLMYGSMPRGGMALLIGPYALAKIMANKQAARWLTTGLKLPKGSAIFASTMARLTDFINIDNDKPAEMPY